MLRRGGLFWIDDFPRVALTAKMDTIANGKADGQADMLCPRAEEKATRSSARADVAGTDTPMFASPGVFGIVKYVALLIHVGSLSCDRRSDGYPENTYLLQRHPVVKVPTIRARTHEAGILEMFDFSGGNHGRLCFGRVR